MKKKITALFMVLFSLVLCLTVLVSCDFTQKTEEEDEDDILIHTHEFAGWEVQTEATCTKSGTRRRVCRCGYIQTEVVSALGHTLSHYAFKDAGCEENGNAEYWYCETCQKSFSDDKGISETFDTVLKKTGHNLLPKKERASTCTEKGYKSHWYCTICGKTFSDAYGKQADDDVYYELTAHKMTYHAKADSTCREEGSVAYYSCSECGLNYADEKGASLLSSVVAEKKPHTFVGGICSVCGLSNIFTVSFSTEGGTAVDSIKIEGGNKITSIPLTYKSGYTFIGWYIDKQCTLPFLFEKKTIESSSLLYAGWQVESLLKNQDPFIILPSKPTIAEDKINVDLQFDGYKFDGYYCEKACVTKATLQDVQTSVYVYSKWTVGAFTFSLSSNGGFFAVTKEEKTTYVREQTKDAKFRSYVTLPKPTKTGYAFGGWSVGEHMLEEKGGQYLIDDVSQLILTAQWNFACDHHLSVTAGKEATCEQAGMSEYYTCEFCNGKFADEGAKQEVIDLVVPALGHKGGTATCKELAQCAVCGKEYGKYLAHTGGKATCIKRAVCTLCKEEYGELASHTGGKGTCSTLAICTVCGKAYGELGHKGGTATCKEQAVCTSCGEYYGAYALTHDYENGVCTVCGANDYLAYTLSNTYDYYILTGMGACTATKLVIPATYNGLPVQAIRGGSFYGNTTLTSVTLPCSVQKIDNNAFGNCTRLSEVRIYGLSSWLTIAFETETANPLYFAKKLYIKDKEVKSLSIEKGKILQYAFAGLQTTQVDIEKDVEVEKGAFYGMQENVTIYFHSVNDRVSLKQGWTEGCSSQIVYGYSTNGTEDEYLYAIVDDGVLLLDYTGAGAKVTIPDTLGGYAVTKIGTAFYNKTNLKEIYLSKDITDYSSLSFYGCTRLTDIYTYADIATWQRLGNELSYDIKYYLTSSCVHDLYFHWNTSSTGTIKIKQITVDEKREKDCSGSHLFDALYCDVCGQAIDTKQAVATKTHTYEYGVCTVCGDREGTEGILYALNEEDKTYTVVGLETSETDIVIPSIYNGRPVTRIGKEALKNSGITGVYIPRSIQAIGEKAFDHCANLATVIYGAEECADCNQEGVFTNGTTLIQLTFSKNVKRIPNYLFYSSKVSTVFFEEESMVSEIGNYAFASCQNLYSISLPKSVQAVCYGAFRDCIWMNTVEFCSQTTVVMTSAFRNCTMLQNVVLAGDIGSIDKTAFLNTKAYKTEKDIIYIDSIAFACDNLDTGALLFREGTTIIVSEAFNNCNATSITLPSTLLYVGDKAFSGCKKVTDIYYNAVSCKDFTAESNIFSGCGQDVTVTFGSQVRDIPAYLFSGASAVKNVIAGDNIVWVGRNVFDNTAWYTGTHITGLYLGKVLYKYLGTESSPTLKNDTTAIGSFAFASTSVVNIVLPDSVQRVGEGAFFDCAKLSSVTLGRGLVTLEKDAFKNCTSLQNIVFYASDFSSQTSAYENAGQKGISVTIDGNMPSIPSYAFYGANVTSFSLQGGSTCTAIGEYAFYGCGFTSLVIPAGIKTIGDFGFASCKDMTSFTVGKDVITLGKGMIAYCDKLSSLSVSGENKKYYAVDNCVINKVDKSLSLGCKGSVFPQARYVLSEFTAIAESIENYAFYGCTALKSMIINIIITTPDREEFRIGKSAFEDSGLETIRLGGTKCAIEEYAFAGCKYLSSFEYNVQLGTADMSGIAQEMGVLSANGTTVTIGDNVERVPDFFFYVNDEKKTPYVTKIVIGEKVKRVGYKAFALLSSVKEIEYNSLGCLEGYSPFESTGDKDGCTLIIGNDVLALGDSMFAYSFVSDVEINVESSKLVAIGTETFAYCERLTSIVLPKDIRYVYDSAFEGCSKLIEIGYYCEKEVYFENGGGLADESTGKGQIALRIQNNVKTIANEQFSSMISLGRVEFSSGSLCETVGENAFEGCDFIRYMRLPFVGENKDGTGFTVFSDLFGGTVPTTLTGIDILSQPILCDYAFMNCTSLEGVGLPADLTVIGESAFEGCTSLKNCALPASLTEIGDRAFFGCTSLREIKIPAWVYVFGEEVFGGCTNLERVDTTDNESFAYSGNGYLMFDFKLVFCTSGTKEILVAEEICKNATVLCGDNLVVYYISTEETWSNVVVQSGNEKLANATILYYSQYPESGGWHFVGNNIVKW